MKLCGEDYTLERETRAFLSRLGETCTGVGWYDNQPWHPLPPERSPKLGPPRPMGAPTRFLSFLRYPLYGEESNVTFSESHDPRRPSIPRPERDDAGNLMTFAEDAIPEPQPGDYDPQGSNNVRAMNGTAGTTDSVGRWFTDKKGHRPYETWAEYDREHRKVSVWNDDPSTGGVSQPPPKQMASALASLRGAHCRNCLQRLPEAVAEAGHRFCDAWCKRQSENARRSKTPHPLTGVDMMSSFTVDGLRVGIDTDPLLRIPECVA